MSALAKHKPLLALVLGLCLWSLAAATPAQAQSQGGAGQRYCIWLLWTKDPAVLKQALERLAQGDPFMVVARQLARQHPTTSQANADCMPAGRMDPAVLAAVRDLKIGQVSRPFDLEDGSALVMRTTDEHRRRAQKLYSQGRFAQAEREMLRDLKLHPASAPAWHMLALTRTAQGRYKLALAALDKALALSPDNPAMLNDKASALASLGRSRQALPIFEKALKLEPDNPTILSNLAWALTLARQNPRRAEALAKKAIKVAPGQARLWHTLAKVQQAQGRHAQAVVSFYRAARLDPRLARPGTEIVKSLLALDPRVVARLANSPAKRPSAPPAPPAAPAKRPAEPKKVEGEALPKGLRPAPRLKGASVTLPQSWPALAQPEEKSQPAPAAGAGSRVVSLPMPKFPPPATPAMASPQAAPSPPSAATQAASSSPPPSPPPSAQRKEQARPPKPTAKARVKRPPARPAKSFYLIQVASYRPKSLAQKELRAWRARKINGRIEKWRDAKGRTWHRVLLGPFASRAQARAQARALKKRRLIRRYYLVKRTAE